MAPVKHMLWNKCVSIRVPRIPKKTRTCQLGSVTSKKSPAIPMNWGLLKTVTNSLSVQSETTHPHIKVHFERVPSSNHQIVLKKGVGWMLGSKKSGYQNFFVVCNNMFWNFLFSLPWIFLFQSCSTHLSYWKHVQHMHGTWRHQDHKELVQNVSKVVGRFSNPWNPWYQTWATIFMRQDFYTLRTRLLGHIYSSMNLVQPKIWEPIRYWADHFPFRKSLLGYIKNWACEIWSAIVVIDLTWSLNQAWNQWGVCFKLLWKRRIVLHVHENPLSEMNYRVQIGDWNRRKGKKTKDPNSDIGKNWNNKYKCWKTKSDEVQGR